MSDPISPALMIQFLLAAGVRPNKRLGQHFLSDPEVLERIVALTGADDRTLAVEIGPGPGTLTAGLAGRAGAVLAVEFDERLREHHARHFGANPSVEFVYADALRVDLHRLAREGMERRGLGRAILTGNLPFQITSPLLFGQTGPDHPWSGMTVMVQREVADRIAARPGGRDCGVLTIKLALWWRVTSRFEVPAALFTPRPQVDAAVLALEPLTPEERPTADEWPKLSWLVDRCFSQRRKKLYNSLHETWQGSPGKEAIREALAAVGAGPDARAETLSAPQFRALAARLAP